MPTPISDIRFARSFIGHNAAGTAQATEIDFGLAATEAIEIFSVYGNLLHNAIPAPVNFAGEFAQQTLHIESDAVVTPNQEAPDADQFDTDSEIMYEQVSNLISADDNANGNGGVAVQITPNGILNYVEPVVSPVNLTHRVELSANTTVGALLIIQYRYVRLSTRELALSFARRRR